MTIENYLKTYDDAYETFIAKYGHYAERCETRAHEFALKIVELEQNEELHRDSQYNLGMMNGR